MLPLLGKSPTRKLYQQLNIFIDLYLSSFANKLEDGQDIFWSAKPPTGSLRAYRQANEDPPQSLRQRSTI